MPWQPSAAGRRAGGTSQNQINFDIDNLLAQIKLGIELGLNEVGDIAFAHAKKHAPVRKVFNDQRAQGGGIKKGMRTLTDLEVAAEAEDRDRLGLGPGRGVRTLGRPGTHPGRPRAPQNYQVDPSFGRVGMPNGEAPYNPNFLTRQQIRPEEKAQRLDLARYADRRQALTEGHTIQPMAQVGGRPGQSSRFYHTIPGEPAALRTNQREVQQADFSPSLGGQRIRPEEHVDQPTRRVDSIRGFPRRPHHYSEITGSLRVREARDALPHGAYGRYEPAVAEITDAMTGRGKYEAGINVTRGAQHAGRAVVMNPETGRLQVGGRLKHSIKSVKASLDQGSLLTYWVDSPTYYTRYVEFGTRHAHAQPFLRPAVGAVREQMRDRIKRAIARSVRR